MITKKELLEKLYADGSLLECWNNIKQWAESIPDDEPQPEGTYPGKYYQPLYDHMHENHNLILTCGEMDEIIDVVKKLDEPATIPFQWPVPDGYEVVTRDGRKVEQVHKFNGIKFPVIGVMDGRLESWKDNGSYNTFEDHAFDLFLRPIEKKVWVVEWSCGTFSLELNYHRAMSVKIHNAYKCLYEATLKPVV